MWTYRDWVIGAFNRNLPFDRFTIEQLAGDLLPDRTLDQQIASGFNRCNMTTNEGGTIPEENLVGYTRDRTETVSQVWLGLTANCAVCHDHKFDPLTQREFYELAAFFNNTTQGALDGNIKDTPPAVFVPDAEDRDRWDGPAGRAGRREAGDRGPKHGAPVPSSRNGSPARTATALARTDARQGPSPERGRWARAPRTRAAPASGRLAPPSRAPTPATSSAKDAFSFGAWIKVPEGRAARLGHRPDGRSARLPGLGPLDREQQGRQPTSSTSGRRMPSRWSPAARSR